MHSSCIGRVRRTLTESRYDTELKILCLNSRRKDIDWVTEKTAQNLTLGQARQGESVIAAV